MKMTILQDMVMNENDGVKIKIIDNNPPAEAEEFKFSEFDFMTIEELKTHNKWPWETLPGKDLPPYLKRLRGDNVTGLEIGVCKGETAYWILEHCPNVKELHGIDPFLPYQDWCVYIDEATIKRQEEIAIENLKQFGDRFKFIKKSSAEAVKDYAPESIDFLFIDGSHNYEDVLQDLTLYYPLLKKEGIIFGHDYYLDGVLKGLKDFRDKNKIRFPIQHIANNVWFWYKK